MIAEVLTQTLEEAFTNNNANANANNTMMNNNNMMNNNSNNRRPSIMVSLIVFTLYLILILLVGKYLWNECLCKVITVCKPVQDIFTLLGVILLVDLIHPRI